MAQENLPADVLHFILEQIDSVPHLETLILIWERAPVGWNVAQVVDRTYVSSTVAKRILEDLERRKFIVYSEPLEQYTYNPAWDATGLFMANVAHVYRRHLLQVSGLIHSKGSHAMREFSRAFQLRKDR